MNAFSKGLLGLASLGAAVGTVYLLTVTGKRSDAPPLELDQVDGERVGHGNGILLCEECAKALKKIGP